MNIKIRRQMARLHKFGIYTVVSIAFLGVATGGGVGPIMGAIFLVALVASWFVGSAGVFKRSSQRWWNALIIGFVALTGAQLLLTQQDVIAAAIRFVLLLTLIKLFSRFSPRDDLQIYALSFLIFAAATTVSQDLTYGLFFGLYVIAGTFSLAIFHLNSELGADAHAAGRAYLDSDERSPFDRRYIAVLSAISLGIFASSLAIFFVFPRVGLGFFVKKSRDQMSVTGFSDSVELGSHGVIRDNPGVVMRVEFPGGPPENYESLHWRTMTFDHYDGRAWSQSIEGSEFPLPTKRRAYDFSVVRTDGWQPPDDARSQRVDVYIEPLEMNLLPRLWPTGSVRFGSTQLRVRWNPLRDGFTADAYADLRHTSENEIGLAYSFSWLELPDPDELRRQEYNANEHGPDPRYLQLPKMSADFLRLAGQVSAGATTPYEKAEAVVAHLTGDYTYTTDLPPVDPTKPIESFVFDTQRGHCEYFASTAVLMLRAAGVPARLVNGFLGGEWNRVGDYLAVRQGDAHAWIEIYVPNFGWIPVDPTPASEVFPTRSSWLQGWLRGTYDAARLHWMKWIIEYDLGAQLALARRAGRILSPAGKFFRGGQDSKTPQNDSPALDTGALIYWLAIAAALALLGWIVLRVAHRRRASALQKSFERVERAGARAGHPRQPDEGPATYLDRLIAAYPAASEALVTFRTRYLHARFGPHPPGPRQLAGIDELSRRIHKYLRARDLRFPRKRA